jgi:formylglycine-generating enzyme required for sulfatase activity
MKKYFCKQHTDYSKRAMETGDHFKNGASPKSQTSRENQFKKIIIALAFIGLSAGAYAQRHSAEPEMVYVEGGTFTMGCTSEQGGDCEDDEKPAHSVTVRSFQIGKYEVTQAQWKAIMGDNPSGFKGDKLPVETVSWDDVQEFISRLNKATGKKYRLPTEAEWEYAARGGNSSKGYKYSGSNNLGEVAWFDDNSGDRTHPAGTKKANELGIYDMSGNVWEWCQDWFGNYSASSQQNPTGASTGSKRVFRGGSLKCNAVNCRVAIRGFDGSRPGYRRDSLGFRVVLP